MVIAIVVYSLIPLVIDFGGGSSAPFLFNVFWSIGFTLSCLLFLVSRYWSWISSVAFWRLVRTRILVWSVVFAVVSHMDLTLFTLSLRMVDTAVATVVFETVPILMVAVTALLFRCDLCDKGTAVVVVVLALAGFALLIFSHHSGRGSLVGIDFSICGLLVVSCAAHISRFRDFIYRWGVDFGRLLFDGSEHDTLVGLELLGVVLYQFVANLATIPLNGAIGLIAGDELSWQSAIIAVLGGMFVCRLANIYLRRTVLINCNSSVIILMHTTSVLSLIWLALFWHIDVERFDYLVVATVGLVSANIVIDIGSKRLLCSDALMVTLFFVLLVVILFFFCALAM